MSTTRSHRSAAGRTVSGWRGLPVPRVLRAEEQRVPVQLAAPVVSEPDPREPVALGDPMELIGTREAGQILGLRQHDVLRLIKSGRITARLMGGRYYVRRGEIEALKGRLGT